MKRTNPRSPIYRSRFPRITSMPVINLRKISQPMKISLVWAIHRRICQEAQFLKYLLILREKLCPRKWDTPWISAKQLINFRRVIILVRSSLRRWHIFRPLRTSKITTISIRYMKVKIKMTSLNRHSARKRWNQTLLRNLQRVALQLWYYSSHQRYPLRSILHRQSLQNMNTSDKWRRKMSCLSRLL